MLFKKTKKKVTVVFGFHNVEQINYFLLSSTIFFANENNSSCSILLMVSPEVENLYGDFLGKHISSLNCFSFEKYIVDFPVGAKRTLGKFYWLFAPYISESDIFLQLDNDLLITFDIDSLLSSIKLSNKYLFYGVRDSVLISDPYFRQTVKDYLNDDAEFEKYKTEYINTGLVIYNNNIKTKLTRDELSKIIGNTVEDLFDLHLKNNKEKFKVFESDQNTIFLNFRKYINPIIENKFNICVGFGFKYYDIIEGYHLNWWINGEKFDYIPFFKKINFEAMSLNMKEQLRAMDFIISEEDFYTNVYRLFKDIGIKYKKEIENISSKFI